MTKDNTELYAAFPDIKPGNIRCMKKRFSDGQGARVMKNTKKVAEPPASQSPPSQDNLKITKELVEYWILTQDPRADLGMKYIQNETKFMDKTEDEEDLVEEFKELLCDVIF